MSWWQLDYGSPPPKVGFQTGKAQPDEWNSDLQPIWSCQIQLAYRHVNPVIKWKITSLQRVFFSSHSFCTEWFLGSLLAHLLGRQSFSSMYFSPTYYSCLWKEKRQEVWFSSLQAETTKHIVNNAKFVRKLNLIKREWSQLPNKLSYITQKITFCILTTGTFLSLSHHLHADIHCITTIIRELLYLYSSLLSIFSFLSRPRSVQRSTRSSEWVRSNNFMGKSPGWVSSPGNHSSFCVICSILNNHIRDSTERPLSL